MKKIGLVGGISWVSTIEYYKAINEGVNAKLGKLHAAECSIYSLNFEELQRVGWNNAFDLLRSACENLVRTNIDAIAFCANTPHMYLDELQAMLPVPMIDIRVHTALKIQSLGISKIGLLGTKFTMEMPFFRDQLASMGVETIVPESEKTRNYIQQTLKEELGVGYLNPTTKRRYLEISDELISLGAEGIILGCTEIPLLVNQSDFSVPTFDTTAIHSQAIVDFITG